MVGWIVCTSVAFVQSEFLSSTEVVGDPRALILLDLYPQHRAREKICYVSMEKRHVSKIGNSQAGAIYTTKQNGFPSPMTLVSRSNMRPEEPRSSRFASLLVFNGSRFLCRFRHDEAAAGELNDSIRLVVWYSSPKYRGT